MEKKIQCSNFFLLNLLFLYSRTRQRYITRWPCPRVRHRGHTTQRARGEIFKLLLRLNLQVKSQVALEDLQVD